MADLSNIKILSNKVLPLLLLLFLAWQSKSFISYGLASYYSLLARKQASLELANYAVNLAPFDADLYYENGILLEKKKRKEEALDFFKKSIELRPLDYKPWFRAGIINEELENYPEAIKNYQRAVELAPFYSQPRWKLGTLIGKYEKDSIEQWKHLRLAGQYDSFILLAVIEKAWMESRGDAEKSLKLLDFTTSKQKLFFALYLLNQGAVIDAMPYLCGNPALDENQRKTLALRLIQQENFKAGFEMEKRLCLKDVQPQIQNAGFEEPIRKRGANFDWQLIENNDKISFSVEQAANNKDGAGALQIEFDGAVAGSNQPILSQMVLTEPNSGYELSFRYKTKELLGDARPQISVYSVADKKEIIAQGEQLPLGTTSAWITGKLKFNAPRFEAVKIALTQNRCNFNACPMFGKIFLDDFRLNKLN